MKKDGKNKFYRTLNLDKETKKLISTYHNLSDQLKTDNEKRKIDDSKD